MAQYINKDAIKTELEKLIRNYWFLSSAEAKYRCVVYMELSEWLDGLDVKEMDLEKEIDDYINEHFMPMARHFFELGLKAKGE